MIVSRVIEVRDGDPVAAVRRFLKALLENQIADRVFALTNLASGGAPRSLVVPGTDTLNAIDPLLPVMLHNATSALRQATASEPQATFVAVLRPCEIRAAIELAKRGEIDLNRVVMVGLDCLGTYDKDFYQEVGSDHLEDSNWLLHETLRPTHVDQATSYRYRSACQMCDRLAADYLAADVLLGLVGVDAREKILILADESSDARLRLHKLTDRKATEREVIEREVALWRLSEARARLAERTLAELGLIESSKDAITAMLGSCILCGECIEACPLSDETMREALKKGRDSFLAALVEYERRLMSCSGCGMCQTHCPVDIPLAAINRVLSRQVQAQFNYIPGRDVKDPLPRMT